MLTWWATGLLAKIQKPNSLVALGSEVSAGGSCSRSVLTSNVIFMCEGVGAGKAAQGRAGEEAWAPEPHSSPHVALSQTEGPTGIIRKSGARKAGPSVCRRGPTWSLWQHTPRLNRLMSSNATPALINVGRVATSYDIMEMAAEEMQ